MIRVLFFGKFSEQVADPAAWNLDSGDVATVADIVARIARHDPPLHAQVTGPQVMVAVNQSVVGVETPVRDGDEVAFLPPVTGG